MSLKLRLLLGNESLQWLFLMPLSVKETVRLRGEAMRLKPMLKIGKNGLSESVLKELRRLLEHHKLVKLRLELGDRLERKAFAEQLAADAQSEFIGLTGRSLVLFKAPAID